MEFSGHILVVSDQSSMRGFLEDVCRREGHRTTSVADVNGAILCLEADDVDVLITDIEVADVGSPDVLDASRRISPDTIVIVASELRGTGDVIDALERGVCDYISKPLNVEEIKFVVETALEKKRLQADFSGQGRFGELIGNSPRMQTVFDLIDQVAPIQTSVLISGEIGTGKELVARAIHDQGKQAGGPFVVFSCGGLSDDLIEKELTGAVGDGFHGPRDEGQGLLEAANGGTLFLDDVSGLSLLQQAQLLRVIQEKVLPSLGGRCEPGFGVRLISATSRSLQREVREGRFRQDLFYRLNVVEIALPPLRQRREDIPLLLRYFMEKCSSLVGCGVDSITDSAMQWLMEYDYPGNVRELENVIERAIALSRKAKIDVDALSPALIGDESVPACLQIPPEGVKLDKLLQDYERALLEQAMQRSHGVKTRAADLLGISFRSFRYRLQKLN